MDFRNGGDLALARGSKTIEKIEFRFCNSPALFLSPGESLPRLSVRDRFPSLTTLILHEIICEESLECLFRELPDTMTTFSLQYDTICEQSTFIDISTVAKLPRHLKTFELACCSIIHPTERDFSFENLLPPNLTHLKLKTLCDITILDHLPIKLKTLRFKTDLNQWERRWKASKMPPELIELYMDLKATDLDIDAPLPVNLERLHCPAHFHPDSKFSIDDLPKNLKNFPMWLFSGPVDMEKVVKTFPKLESACIDRETTFAILPETLKTLESEIWLRLDSPLPSALTELTLPYLPPIQNLNNIPPYLRSLQIADGSLVRKDLTEELIRDFPPWTESDFDQLGTQIHLVSLYIECRLIDSVFLLSPLAKLGTLKNFCLTCISLDDLLEVPTWLPNCLSPTLNHLTIGSNDLIPVEPYILKTDLWSLVDFQQVTPQLKSLVLYCYYEVEVLWSAQFFASLPRELIKLNLDHKCAALAPSAVPHLPKGLQFFHIVVNPKYSGTEVSDGHFEGLPPSLARFWLTLGDQRHPITPKLFEILPQNIVCMGWPITGRSEEFHARRGEFLRSHPITKGFRPQKRPVSIAQ